MEFGSVPIGEATGGVLAHSVALAGGKLKKGTVLGGEDVARLREAGVERVTVARLGPDDLGEDAAALMLAQALIEGKPGLVLSRPFTGRVNILAEEPGLARLDVARLHAVNAVDEMLTLATVPDWHRMDAGGMVATVKVISYGVAHSGVAAAVEAGRGAIGIAPVTTRTADLIVTEHDAGSTEDTGRGYRAIEARLTALGMTLEQVTPVPHAAGDVAFAVAASRADMVLILTASATSDPRDVGPEGLRQAGGQVTRFGMPVDPGNLLFYGTAADGRPVIGLPGCARSPAMNGADWVLERLAVGCPPTVAEISAMGVGGLLKEIPTRKQPRNG